MKHPERVADYLEHIAKAMQQATEYIEGLGSLSAFRQSQRDQDAVIRNIEIIGEAARADGRSDYLHVLRPPKPDRS